MSLGKVVATKSRLNGNKAQKGQCGTILKGTPIKQWNKVYLSMGRGVTLAGGEPQSLSRRQSQG